MSPDLTEPGAPVPVNKVMFSERCHAIDSDRHAMEYLAQFSEVLVFGSLNGGRSEGRCHRGVFGDHYYRVRVTSHPCEIEAEAILPSVAHAFAFMVAVAEGAPIVVRRANELLPRYRDMLKQMCEEFGWEAPR